MLSSLWSESGVPGISRLASSSSRVRRLCWTLALLSLLALTVRDLALLTRDYLGHPVHVLLRVEDSRVLAFPAVTVCNVNPAHRNRFCADSVPKPEAVRKIVCASVTELLQHHCPLLSAKQNQSGCVQKKVFDRGPNFGSILGDLAKSAVKGVITQVNEELGGAVGELFRKAFKETTGCSFGSSNEKLPDVVTKLLEDLTSASSGCPLGSPQSLLVLNDLVTNIMSSLSSCRELLLRDLSHLVEGEDAGSEIELSGVALLAEAIRRTLLELHLASPGQARLVGHRAEDLVVGCVFSGQPCYHRDLDWFFTPSTGNCFTFNALKTSGQKEDAEEEQAARKTSFTGPSHGLELTLNLETRSYLPSTGECGVKVLVHSREQRPDPDQDAIHVPSGAVTYLGLRMVNISRLPSPYEDACAKSWPEEDHLGNWAGAMGFTEYSPQICLKLCLQRRTWDTCGCFAASAPVPPQLAQGKQCINNTDRICQRSLQSDYYNGRYSCLCPPRCSDINYQKSVSTGTQLLECSVLSDSRLRKVDKKDLAKISIFYQSLSYQEITQSPKYTAFALVGGVGGILGAYAGFSLLAIFETFEVLVRSALTIASATRNINEEKKLNSNPRLSKRRCRRIVVVAKDLQ